jgi:hypothetical protein
MHGLQKHDIPHKPPLTHHRNRNQISKSVLRLAEKAAAEMRKEGDVARPELEPEQTLTRAQENRLLAEGEDRDNGIVTPNLLRLARQAKAEQDAHMTRQVIHAVTSQQAAPKIDILKEAQDEQKEDRVLADYGEAQSGSGISFADMD